MLIIIILTKLIICIHSPNQQGCTNESEDQDVQHLCPSCDNLWYGNHGTDTDEHF